MGENIMDEIKKESVTHELLKKFPIDAHKSRRGGGGKEFTYVETHTYLHRLINVTNNTFDWVIKEFKKEGELLTVVGTLTIPGLGSRDGIGVQVYKPNSGEDLIKSVSSDAIKSAAKLFGVCLYLYGNDYEGGENHDDQPTHPPQRPATPHDPLHDAKAEYAAACKKFFAGMKLSPADYWSLYAWSVGDGKASAEECVVGDWAGAAAEVEVALAALRDEIIRLKSGEGNLHQSKASAIESGLPESLWQKLYSVTRGG